MTKKLGSDRNIAVIVPVYNTGKSKLTKCIHSILTQTHRNITLILVDDGSTDESGRICDRFTKRDDRIEVIHQSQCRQSGGKKGRDSVEPGASYRLSLHN